MRLRIDLILAIFIIGAAIAVTLTVKHSQDNDVFEKTEKKKEKDEKN